MLVGVSEFWTVDMNSDIVVAIVDFTYTENVYVVLELIATFCLKELPPVPASKSAVVFPSGATPVLGVTVVLPTDIQAALSNCSEYNTKFVAADSSNNREPIVNAEGLNENLGTLFDAVFIVPV